MEQVIAILFQIEPDNVFHIMNAVSMTLNECMDSALKINSNANIPQLLVCAPDLSNPVVVN